MLRRLHIQNLILVEECELTFDNQFNVITGETGSGKSVILSAIGLLTGDRADKELVRHGSEKAVVEGLFSLQKPLCDQPLCELLEEYSLEELASSMQIEVRREILSDGKSRSFINGTAAPLHLLKKLGERLIEFSTQHAHIAMKQDSFGLSVLDALIPDIDETVGRYALLLREYKCLLESQKSLKDSLDRRDIETQKLMEEIRLIEESRILEIDADELFHEYSRLEEASEQQEELNSISRLIDGGEAGGRSPLQQLAAMKQLLDRKSEIAAFSAVRQHISAAHAELSEASFLIKKMADALHTDSRALNRMEQELTKIDKVEKRWGKERPDIAAKLQEMKAKLEQIACLDEEIASVEKSLQLTDAALTNVSHQLHEMRTLAARTYEPLIEKELSELNMPNCRFHIDVATGPRGARGISYATLSITPNVGEKKVSVAQGASGGEMARIFLAIQTLCSSLEQIPTIIFDEIDANIGGMTAGCVGEKLASIGRHRQVIAITHFPQVADYAAHHFVIRKESTNLRTKTYVEALSRLKEKDQEKQRMIGIK